MRIADWNYCTCELLFGISVDANCYLELLNMLMLLGISVDANCYSDAQNYYTVDAKGYSELLYRRILAWNDCIDANISL